MIKITKLFVYIFLAIGVFLIFFVVINIFYDDKVSTTIVWDELYLKSLSDIANFIALPWSIAGVFLVYLTFNAQQKQFAETESSIRRQQFETSFFNMLNVLSTIKTSTNYEFHASTGNTNNTGLVKSNNEFFHFVLFQLKNKFLVYHNELDSTSMIKTILEKVRLNQDVTELDVRTVKDDLNGVYLKFYEDYHNYLAHYFRYVYNLIKFAITNRSKDNDEKTYIDLIQAQLTNNELALLFYNAYSDNGYNRNREYQFQQWLDKYEFFENIDERSLLLREHHILYKKTRFKFLNTDELRKKRH